MKIQEAWVMRTIAGLDFVLATVFFCCMSRQTVAFQNVAVPSPLPMPFYTPNSAPPAWLRDNPEDDAALEKLQAVLEKKVNLRFENSTLTQVVVELQKQVGAVIQIDTVKLSEEGISIDEPIRLELERAVPLREALKGIFHPLGLTYSTKRKYWLTITTSSDTASNLVRVYDVSTICPTEEETNRLINLIQNSVDGRWDEGTDTIGLISAVMVVSAPDEAQEGIENLLRQLAKSHGKQYSAPQDLLTPGKNVDPNLKATQSQARPDPANNRDDYVQDSHEMDLAARDKVAKALETKGKFHFWDTLPSILEQLEELSGAEFRLDSAGIIEDGIDLNQMIEFSVDAEVPVRVALAALLEPLALTYTLDQDYWVEITTRARASRNTVQVFDLSYVLPNNYFATELMIAIQNCIEGRWDEGTDTIQIIGASMVVSAPEETLQGISKLLHRLRKCNRLNFVGADAGKRDHVTIEQPSQNPSNQHANSNQPPRGLGGGMGGMGGGMGGAPGIGGGGGNGIGGYFGMAETSGDRFARIEDNGFQNVEQKPLSTFSIDVDTASFSKIRQNLLEYKSLPPTDAVRIEEMVNYFEYDYQGPKNDDPFAASLAVANCPWEPDHQLVRVALQARKIDLKSRPDSNLVFLLDVSGSMAEENKLPLVQEAIGLLVEQLRENDRVAIVVYAGAAGLVLESTPGSEKQTIRNALSSLSAGGSTNGGEGIELAYRIARENFIDGGTNRIILCTDGDFNVGVTDTTSLVDMVAANAKDNIFLTVLGFGMGNTNDELMEKISNDGNGFYGFVDSDIEARRMMVEQLTGSLITVAKDVKIQVEFNPAKVAQYRLVGYENRLLSTADFKNDRKDAGDIGAGHSVTALYEIIRTDLDAKDEANEPLRYSKATYQPNGQQPNELLTAKIRYKEPTGATSSLLEFPFVDEPLTIDECDQNFRWAAAMAQFGLLLRKSEHRGESSWAALQECATEAAGENPDKYRRQALEMISQAIQLVQH